MYSLQLTYTGIESATDYYPFGMGMPGRSFSSSKYRFGFNGQEKTDEIFGDGNHTTAEYWEYDTRLGRRWNLDPVFEASESRYVVNGDNPICYFDPLGDFKTWLGAKLYSLTHKGVTNPYKSTKKSKVWVVNKKAYMEGNQTVVSVVSHWDNKSNGLFITGDDDGSQSPGPKANKIWGSLGFSELDKIFGIIKTSLIRDLNTKIINPLVEIGEEIKDYLFGKKKGQDNNENMGKVEDKTKTTDPDNTQNKSNTTPVLNNSNTKVINRDSDLNLPWSKPDTIKKDNGYEIRQTLPGPRGGSKTRRIYGDSL